MFWKKLDPSSPSLTQQPPLASTSSKRAHSIKFTVYFLETIYYIILFKILLLCMVSLQERFVIKSGSTVVHLSARMYLVVTLTPQDCRWLWISNKFKQISLLRKVRCWQPIQNSAPSTSLVVHKDFLACELENPTTTSANQQRHTP